MQKTEEVTGMDEKENLTEMENSAEGSLEKTEKAMRIAGRIVLGALAAVLGAEALSFRKKR